MRSAWVRSIGKFFLLGRVDIVEYLIEEGLVVLYCIFHHDCLSFPIALIELVGVFGGTEEISVVLLHILGVVGKGRLDL